MSGARNLTGTRQRSTCGTVVFLKVNDNILQYAQILHANMHRAAVAHEFHGSKRYHVQAWMGILRHYGGDKFYMVDTNGSHEIEAPYVCNFADANYQTLTYSWEIIYQPSDNTYLL